MATEALSLGFPQEGHPTPSVRVGREGKYRGQKKAIGRFCNLIPRPLRSRRGRLTLRLVRMVGLTEQGIPWGQKQNRHPDSGFVARATSATWAPGSFLYSRNIYALRCRSYSIGIRIIWDLPRNTGRDFCYHSQLNQGLGYSSVVERLPRMLKALGSIPRN